MGLGGFKTASLVRRSPIQLFSLYVEATDFPKGSGGLSGLGTLGWAPGLQVSGLENPESPEALRP